MRAGFFTEVYRPVVNGIVASIDALAGGLRELGVDAPIDVIPTGIDLRRFSAGERSESLRASLGVGAGGRLLFFVSRLAKEKNVELLLEALVAMQDERYVLAIAGDGPER